MSYVTAWHRVALAPRGTASAPRRYRVPRRTPGRRERDLRRVWIYEARGSLIVDEPVDPPEQDGGVDAGEDAEVDAGADAGVDAGTEAGVDAG